MSTQSRAEVRRSVGSSMIAVSTVAWCVCSCRADARPGYFGSCDRNKGYYDLLFFSPFRGTAPDRLHDRFPKESGLLDAPKVPFG